MINRKKVENDMIGIFQKFSYGFTSVSALCEDFLPKEGTSAPDIQNSEVNQISLERMESLYRDSYDIAKALGHTISHLTLAWAMFHQDITSTVVNVSDKDQLNDSLQSRDCLKKMNSNDWEKMEIILGNRPSAPMNWKTWTLFPYRR